MNYTIEEVLQFIEENDVKFVRLAFCDIFGNLKNISIMAVELSKAFTYGISFDASAVKGFMNVEDSDLFLFPDPSTLSILPWRPKQGQVVRFFCHVKNGEGKFFDGDGRLILKNAMEKAKTMGYECKIGAECEFYLFELDEKGQPTTIPHDEAGYMDVGPLDKGENVRREICLTLEEMGFYPESSHHEQGPGQNEIDFKYSDALLAADNLATFKSVVKTIAAQHGLYASFMPKPILNKSGSGLHINMSLSQEGKNVFNHEVHTDSAISNYFIAGIMNRIHEITVFLNPITNSYKRFGSFEAPQYITWSPQNRSQLIRIPAARGDYSRMELRSADPACNPYLAFAMLIYAGLEGIEKKILLPPSTDCNLYTAEKDFIETLKPLPDSLGVAIALAKESDFVKAYLPMLTIEKYLKEKGQEWKQYQSENDTEKIEKAMYFFRL